MFGKKNRAAEDPIDVVEASEADEESVDVGLEGGITDDSDEYESSDGTDEDEDDYEDEAPRARDPYVGWMTLLSMLLLLVVVASTVALVLFLLGMRGAPRTAVERLITATEAAAKADPSADKTRQLAYAYVAAGRYSDALAQIRRGRKIKDSSEFDLAEADVLRAQGKHEAAVKMYEKAAKRNNAEVQTQADAMAKRGIFLPPSRTTLVSIMIGQGDSLETLGRKKEALKVFKVAVKNEGTNSYALVRVGDLEAALDNDKAAKAAYDEALRFIPDYEPALKGLARLTDGKKE